MKGLVYKDYLHIRRLIPSLLIGFLVFGAVNTLFDYTSSSGALIYIAIACTNITFTLFSLDGSCSWSHFAIASPVSRKQIVMARFISIYSMLLALMAIVSPVTILLDLLVLQSFNIGAFLSTLVVGLAFGMIMSSIQMAMIYRFGIEKIRLLSTLTFIIPLILTILLLGVGFNTDNTSVFVTLIVGLLILGVTLVTICYRASCHYFVRNNY